MENVEKVYFRVCTFKRFNMKELPFQELRKYYFIGGGTKKQYEQIKKAKIKNVIIGLGEGTYVSPTHL